MEAQLLTLKNIRPGLPVFETLFREVDAVYPTAPDKLKFNEALKRILDRFVTGLIEGTSARVKRAEVHSVDDVRQHPERLVGFEDEVDRDRAACKKFLYANLYFSKALEPEKEEAERVIRELFGNWMRRPSDLPSAYREKSRVEPLPRVICDYLAGMTDHFILEQYDRFCG